MKYDLKKISETWERLNVPPGYYNPLDSISHGARWHLIASERSVGKTTQLLLLGLCMNYLYDTRIIYVRDNARDISPSVADELTAVIVSYNGGQYIKTLTNGHYNGIYYHWRKMYFCYYDENGNRIETAPKPFLHMLAISENQRYKSVLNVPTGDLIIWDECVTPDVTYQPDFIGFCDLLKTIGRDRDSLFIFLLCNTVNLTSQLFRDLEIYKQLPTIPKGTGRVCYTSTHMPVWVEILGNKLIAKRQMFNDLYMGFSNPQLDAITGAGVWAFKCVPHIVREPDKHIANRDISISYHGELLGLDFVETPTFGSVLEVHPLTNRRKILLTTDDIRDRSENRTPPAFARTFRDLNRAGRVRYSDNATGHIFESYLMEC